MPEPCALGFAGYDTSDKLSTHESESLTSMDVAGQGGKGLALGPEAQHAAGGVEGSNRTWHSQEGGSVCLSIELGSSCRSHKQCHLFTPPEMHKNCCEPRAHFEM